MRHSLLIAGLLLISGCTSVHDSDHSGARVPEKEIFGPLNGLEPGVVPGDALPVVLTQVQPAYPYWAWEKKIKGKAQIEFTVEIDGSVRKTRIVSESAAGFGIAASECVKKWTFKPALKKGVPVRCAMSVPFDFVPMDPTAHPSR